MPSLIPPVFGEESKDIIERLAAEVWRHYEQAVMREARSAFNRLLTRKRQENKEE